MNKPKTTTLAAAEIKPTSFLWRLLWYLCPCLPEMSSMGKTLCRDSTRAGMTLGRKGSFLAFVGLQTSTFPLSTSQDGSQVAGAAGLTPKKELYVPVSLLPIAGSETKKLNQQPQLTTFFT